jgi:hypothetical protein
MYMNIKHRQKRERITLPPISFYGRPNKRLLQNKICKFMQMKQFGIGLEKLTEQSFESMIVDLRIWIEEFEVHINKGSRLLAVTG